MEADHVVQYEFNCKIYQFYVCVACSLLRENRGGTLMPMMKAYAT